MLTEARDALEKFVERRSADVEGLYYLGRTLKAQGDTERAREVFAEAVASANSSPGTPSGRRCWSPTKGLPMA